MKQIITKITTGFFAIVILLAFSGNAVAQNKKLTKLDKLYKEKNYEDCYLVASDLIESDPANKADYLMFKVAAFTSLPSKNPSKVENKDWLLTALDYLLQSKEADLNKDYVKFYKKINKKVQKKAYKRASKQFKKGKVKNANKYFDLMYKIFDDSNKTYKNLYGNKLINEDLGKFLTQNNKKAKAVFEKNKKFAKWDHPKYRMLNTAAEYSCSDTEKNIILLLNMMQANPTLFANTYLKCYTDVKGSDEALASLTAEIKKMQTKQALLPGKSVFASAVCFAKESGKYDIQGHERMYCKGGIPAKEALGYINTADPSAMEIVMHILHDKDSATKDNRKVLLGTNTEIGVSVQTHVSFKKVVVIDFQ